MVHDLGGGNTQGVNLGPISERELVSRERKKQAGAKERLECRRDKSGTQEPRSEGARKDEFRERKVLPCGRGFNHWLWRVG